MIKNIRLFVLAITISVLVIGLNLPFPHETRIGEALLSGFNIFSSVKGGAYIVGIVSAGLLICCLYALNKSIRNYHAICTFISYIVMLLGPQLLVQAYQHTFASGIHAISYNKEER